MRYGQISYDEWDVENWNQRWQPSEKVIGTFRLDYEYEIEYEYDFRISNQ